MHCLIVAVAFGFAATTCAGTFKLPLKYEKLPMSQLERRTSTTQKPLKHHSLSEPGALGRSKLKTYLNIFYKINITIGDPPQLFNVAIDTSADHSLIPSATCTEECDPRQISHPYDHTLSSTYKPEGGPAFTEWAFVDYDGLWSRDTVHIGDLDIPDYVFEEWQHGYCVGFAPCIREGYDGVLGLSPPWRSPGLEKPNLLTTLLALDSLDAPMFSLKLPSEQEGEGELLFGTTNPKLNSSTFTNIPVVNKTSIVPFFNESWTVSFEYISFASTDPIHFTPPSLAYAVLDSAWPLIGLPTELATNLTVAIGADKGHGPFHTIACERRQELPPLTFTLGGHNFSISAFEYIIETSSTLGGHEKKLCFTTFMEGGFLGVPDNGSIIVLGNPFLKGFYSSWNFGNQEVGFAKLA